MPHNFIIKLLHVLKTVVANKWLNETTEAVGDNRRHNAEHGDLSAH